MRKINKNLYLIKSAANKTQSEVNEKSKEYDSQSGTEKSGGENPPENFYLPVTFILKSELFITS